MLIMFKDCHGKDVAVNPADVAMVYLYDDETTIETHNKSLLCVNASVAEVCRKVNEAADSAQGGE